MRWVGLTLVIVAAGWLAHGAFRFLAAPFPGYGMWIGVPMDGSVHFENGNLRTISGSIHAVDFSPWWLASILASIAVLVTFAARGCLLRGTIRR